MVATTLAETASLWAIRISMILMVLVFGAELRGAKPTGIVIAQLWCLGALFALAHSTGAMLTFHHGSQEAALESTARQTEQVVGLRIGAGLYVNYLFVFVWHVDAALRLLVPNHYARFPNSYRYWVIGFLIFIAINGAIVFQSGVTRYVGIACLAILGTFVLRRDRKNS